MGIELAVNLENHKRRIWSICWSPDGTFLGSVGSDKYIIIWHKKKNATIRYMNSGNKIMNTSNKHGGNVYLKRCIEFDIYDIIETNHEKSLRHIEFSKDGNFFVVASFDSKCSIYKKNRNNKWVFYKTLEGHEKEVKCASIHPLNKYIVTCGRDKSIWVHAKVDNFEKKKIPSNHSKNISSNHISPTNNMLLDDNDFDFSFDAYLTAHTEDIKFVSWCPLSEDTFISLSYDNSIKIWNKKADEWSCIQTLNEHSSVVWCVTFNCDGSEFATCSDDKTIKIWQSEKKKLYNKKKYPFLYQQIVKDIRETVSSCQKGSLGKVNKCIENKKKDVKEQIMKRQDTNEKKKTNINNRELIKEKRDNKNINNKVNNKLNEKESKKLAIKEENYCISNDFITTCYSENGYNSQAILKIIFQNKFIPIYFHFGLFKFLYKYSKITKGTKQNNDSTFEEIKKDKINEKNEVLKPGIADKANISNDVNNNKYVENKMNKHNEEKINKNNVAKMSNVEKTNSNINKTKSHKKEVLSKGDNKHSDAKGIKNINEKSDNSKDATFDDWKVKHIIEGYHKRSVSYLDWNPYENLIAVASFDNSLKIFEKIKGKWSLIENVENAHLSDVNCVVWCPQKFQDYFLLATAGDDCVINIWKFMKN